VTEPPTHRPSDDHPSPDQRSPDRRTVLAGAAGLGLGGLAAPLPRAVPRSFSRVGLSHLQLAGMRVIYSYPGLTPPASLLTAISKGQASGVIFFGENISSTSQIAGVVAQLRQAQAQSPVKAPLLLMTDQEGGLVRRLPGDPALSEKQVGQSADPVAAATTAGTGAAHTLSGVGMNVNLAPVLDVFYQAGNFIDQFGRSYGNDPAVVSECGKAFITAQQSAGVAATAKHFPGLGAAATAQNTDTGPVTITQTASRLRGFDEVPYPTAVAAGVDLVMLSWAVYPALDPNLPAGLSPTIVGQELRSRIGFGGVTITDALEAGALSAFGTIGQRAVSAASAGMDLILCSARDASQGATATTALSNALGSGKLDPIAFNAAVGRIFSLRLGLT